MVLAGLELAYDWSQWASAPGTKRQLIISQDLFPSALNGSDWLAAGARGAYEGHARRWLAIWWRLVWGIR